MCVDADMYSTDACTLEISLFQVTHVVRRLLVLPMLQEQINQRHGAWLE